MMTAEIYIVRPGDTLGKIAARYSVSIDELAQANHIRDRNKIVVGQRLLIPGKQEDKLPVRPLQRDEGSETIMRFVDSLGRPIVGLMVRLLAAGKELRGTTDASGCLPPLRCDKTNEAIDIHVEKAQIHGGGEKKIGSYMPRAGLQRVRVESGRHVEKSALRSHEGSPGRPPRKLPPIPAAPLETRNSAGNPLACSVGCECPNEDDLKLGVNNIYREWVKRAALRAGMIPQAVAAVMRAEAAKDKTGQWKADSRSPGSSATGMTQFLDSSWLAEAMRTGTYLNAKVRQEGWLKPDAKGGWCFMRADGTSLTGPGLERKLLKLMTGKRRASDRNLQKLLDLRYEPEFAIMAAMDYAKFNLDALDARGYAINDLNDTEKARIMYLCHHLGLADAIHFIQDDIPEEDLFVEGKDGKKRLRQNGAKKLLSAQVGESRALKEFVKPNGDSWVMGHRQWLQGFMKDNITPHVFSCPSEKLEQLKTEEKNGALLKITEKLKK